MASNQVDVLRDNVLKHVNLVLLVGKWVKFGSTSDLKQKRKGFGAIAGNFFNINLLPCACELWHIRLYNI